ncbi:hypothetical protein PC110_g20690 [Phytophthora cactorum]|uniref:HTH psq-type domain-containing protein n=6 Tax=Phytophthora cactorum TaxID=29920 RepID=A0A329REE5_9STRA|nr:hypothetical protein PC110_g20690 [Phytophthora cactorum]
MNLQGLPCVSARRYLSEAGEKETLRVLKEQLRRQERITSDDVRLAARSVASQGGDVLLPPDFPPSRWVHEFKRAHGFVHFNSFAFGAAVSNRNGDKAVARFGLSERLEVPPLRPMVPAVHTLRPSNTTAPPPTTSSSSSCNRNNDKRNSSSCASEAQVTGSGLSSGNSSDNEKKPSGKRRFSRSSEPARVVMYSMSPLGPRVPFDSETQRQVQLRHSFSQRHRQNLQQQQRRADVVDGRRRSAAWSIPMRDSAVDHEEMGSNTSNGNENGTTPDFRNVSRGGGDVGASLGMEISSMPPFSQHEVSHNGSSVDEMQEMASNASTSNDKRGYKLSHTVPAETWEKAIVAVEQQGMSLRAAAKLYGVHFAALHRRVKKRAQAVHAKGTNGYFHPSDEAGIMRVVVARAELGVLMTFDELMRLVEAAALRKLPDISMDSARKLLTRFQSRNEQSIRHIIEDWPLPRPAVHASSTSTEGIRPQHQPHLEHPGFDVGLKPLVILRPQSVGTPSQAANAAAVAAVAMTNLFVPPSRLGPPPSSDGSRVDEVRRPRMRFMNGNVAMTMDNGVLPSVPNDRLRFVGPRARSEGDSDPVMVV